MTSCCEYQASRKRLCIKGDWIGAIINYEIKQTRKNVLRKIGHVDIVEICRAMKIQKQHSSKYYNF
jgi:hypothetical protein